MLNHSLDPDIGQGDPERHPGRDEAPVLGKSEKELAKENGREEEVHLNQREQHTQRPRSTRKHGA